MQTAAPGHVLVQRYDPAGWYVECVNCNTELLGPIMPTRGEAIEAMYRDQPQHFLINTKAEADAAATKLRLNIAELGIEGFYIGYNFLGHRAFGIEVRFRCYADMCKAALPPHIDGIPIDIDVRAETKVRHRRVYRTVESLPPL